MKIEKNTQQKQYRIKKLLKTILLIFAFAGISQISFSQVINVPINNSGTRISSDLTLDKCGNRLKFNIILCESNIATDYFVFSIKSDDGSIDGKIKIYYYTSTPSGSWTSLDYSFTYGSNPTIYWYAKAVDLPGYITDSYLGPAESEITWNYGSLGDVNVTFDVEYKKEKLADASTTDHSYSDIFDAQNLGLGLPPLTVTSIEEKALCSGEIEYKWSWPYNDIDDFKIFLSKIESTTGAAYEVIPASQNTGTVALPDATWYDIPLYTRISGYSTICGYATSGWVEINPVASAITETTGITSSQSGNSIRVNWTNPSSGVDKFLIERSTATGGNSTFEVPGGVFTYLDSEVMSCITYNYRIRAMGDCPADGILSSSKASRKITPILTTTFNTTVNKLECSKGYFNDKIKLEWNYFNQDKIDNFKIWRRAYGSTDPADYSLIASIDPTSVYMDETAAPGVLYEYEIQGFSECEGSQIPSNTSSDIGLRIATAIVNGHIEYKNGQAVEDVQVVATKSSGSAKSGR